VYRKNFVFREAVFVSGGKSAAPKGEKRMTPHPKLASKRLAASLFGVAKRRALSRRFVSRAACRAQSNHQTIHKSLSRNSQEPFSDSQEPFSQFTRG